MCQYTRQGANQKVNGEAQYTSYESNLTEGGGRGLKWEKVTLKDGTKIGNKQRKKNKVEEEEVRRGRKEGRIGRPLT